MNINIPIISFDYRLNTIICVRTRKVFEHTIEGEWKKSNVDLYIGLDEFRNYSNAVNVDGSKAEAKEVNFWHIGDVTYTNHDGEILGFPSDRQFVKELDSLLHGYDFTKFDNRLFNKALLLKIFDKVDFDTKQEIKFVGQASRFINENMLKRYRKEIWKTIDSGNFKTFVGDYRFNQLEAKYNH